mmetsp:Transcript_8543/g.21989  ORF Transcript_8543/g.21989 Transcript_8543/m.21989 type:complete len:208 (+) Transcript_8543:159-782(+)
MRLSTSRHSLTSSSSCTSLSIESSFEVVYQLTRSSAVCPTSSSSALSSWLWRKWISMVAMAVYFSYEMETCFRRAGSASEDCVCAAEEGWSSESSAALPSPLPPRSSSSSSSSPCSDGSRPVSSSSKPSPRSSSTSSETTWTTDLRSRDAASRTYSTLTSSSQCSRARASANRIIDSSCRTVIRYEDFVREEASFCRSLMYSDTTTF